MSISDLTARNQSAVNNRDLEQDSITEIGHLLPVDRDWPILIKIAVQLAIIASVIAVWEFGARIGLVDTFFWSKPSDIWIGLKTFIVDGDGWIDVQYTVEATLLGFAIGTSIGGILGLSFWWSRNYAAIVQPFVISFEATPKLALAPLIILMFGSGLASKVAIGAALTVVVTTLTTYAGVRALDQDLQRLLYSLGANRMQVFTKLVVPSTLPWIISVLRINIGLALTGSVVGEFIASRHGLGRQIVYASETYNISLIWVAVLILSSLSIIMYVLVSHLERWLIKGVTHDAQFDADVKTTS